MRNARTFSCCLPVAAVGGARGPACAVAVARGWKDTVLTAQLEPAGNSDRQSHAELHHDGEDHVAPIVLPLAAHQSADRTVPQAVRLVPHAAGVLNGGSQPLSAEGTLRHSRNTSPVAGAALALLQEKLRRHSDTAVTSGGPGRSKAVAALVRDDIPVDVLFEDDWLLVSQGRGRGMGEREGGKGKERGETTCPL